MQNILENVKLEIINNELQEIKKELKDAENRLEILENLFRCPNCKSKNILEILKKCFHCGKKICTNCYYTLETKQFSDDNVIIYSCKECK